MDPDVRTTIRRQRSSPLEESLIKTVTMVTLMLFSGLCVSMGALGENEERCAKRYGSGEVKFYDAESHQKTMYYSHWFSADISIDFLNDKAIKVSYLGDLGEASITEYLDLNAQGHQWTLVSKNGTGTGYQTWRTYKRDDGATAEWHNFMGPTGLVFELTPAPAPRRLQVLVGNFGDHLPKVLPGTNRTTRMLMQKSWYDHNGLKIR